MPHSRKKSKLKSKLKILKSKRTIKPVESIPKESVRDLPDSILLDIPESKYSKCIADDCYFLPINTTLSSKSVGQSMTNPYEISGKIPNQPDDSMIKCIKQNKYYDRENKTCSSLTQSSWDKIHIADKSAYCSNNYMTYNPERNSCTTSLNDFKYYTNKIEDLMLQKSNNMKDPEIKKYIKLLISVVSRTLTIVNGDSIPLDLEEINTSEDYYKQKEELLFLLKNVNKNLKEAYGDPEIDVRKLKFYRYLMHEDNV